MDKEKMKQKFLGLKCSVCKERKRKSHMQFLPAQNMWLCNECKKKGDDNNIQDIEQGRKLTAQIRGEELDGEDN